MCAKRRIDQETALWWPASGCLRSLDRLTACAAHLAGPRVQLSAAENALLAPAGRLNDLPRPAHLITGDVLALRAAIRAGDDPLGAAYCDMQPAAARRVTGTVYTPARVVDSMISWAVRMAARTSAEGPVRIVDPGCGSGRFLLAAARRFPQAALIGVDTDPVATLLLRANAAVLGCSTRLSVHVADYRAVRLPPCAGPTLFIGNPPYVRHHHISAQWKGWFAQTAARYGLKASKLAGLHVHFFLRTRELARPGDFGAFITSAEWLDVNYGAVLRALLNDGLPATAIHVLAPQLQPFADAITTGVITCFRVGDQSAQIRIRRVSTLADLADLADDQIAAFPRTTLRRTPKWSNVAATPPLTRGAASCGHGAHGLRGPGIELGELFSVHRGQVTGANNVWIAGAYSGDLPECALTPAVTRARELFSAGEVLTTLGHLRRVIDLPIDLAAVPDSAREAIERFLAWARRQGAHQTYIARHRAAWWSVGLRAPAPLLCTYMARRPPAFVRNLCAARHINIAHGLYPRQTLSEAVLVALVRHLRRHVAVESGRTYAGGLTKFEPRELERVTIPRLEDLDASAADLDTERTQG